VFLVRAGLDVRDVAKPRDVDSLRRRSGAISVFYQTAVKAA
jgi:uncharacterized protein (DUF934 family)